MIAQHQIVGVAQVFLQACFFIVTDGYAFIALVGQGGQHKRALLTDGQDAVSLGADCHACAGMGVQDTSGIFANLVHCAVNYKAGRIDGEGVVVEFVALHVHLDQAGGGDFVEHQTVGVDQKLVRVSRHAVWQLGADVRKDQVAPTVQSH